MKALREGRKQRAEDHKLVRQALGNSLLFKMISLHSNFYHIHQHIEDGFEKAERNELRVEPWQIVQPIVNAPDPIHFSPEEMGLLLGLKSDDVFNMVASMDTAHNSITAAVKFMSTERRSLTERIKPDSAEGAAVSGTLGKEELLALRPSMIQVNTLIEAIRANAKRGNEESAEALNRLNEVLKAKLGLTYELVSIPPKEQ